MNHIDFHPVVLYIQQLKIEVLKKSGIKKKSLFILILLVGSSLGYIDNALGGVVYKKYCSIRFHRLLEDYTKLDCSKLENLIDIHNEHIYNVRKLSFVKYYVSETLMKEDGYFISFVANLNDDKRIRFNCLRIDLDAKQERIIMSDCRGENKGVIHTVDEMIYPFEALGMNNRIESLN